MYVPLVASAVFYEQRAALWVLTGLACILVLIGAFFPVVNSDLPDLIGNRVLSILAILATAVFVHHARATQVRLAAATRKAEAAERIKAELLANLSQDMRTPLHGLLGVLNLMLADCRPDQREALSRVRGDGKQLLDSIDNLIDLTQLDERRLQPQAVDVGVILRDAAHKARLAAEDSRITVHVADAHYGQVWGDPWAIGRILDNLIRNAVRFSPPSSLVSLSATQRGDHVVMTVTDAGSGLPMDLQTYFQNDDTGELPMTGGTGLNLCNRLARRMNGQLTATDGSGGRGTALSLTLPAPPG